MPNDRRTRVAELVFARALVVVTQQEVILGEQLAFESRKTINSCKFNTHVETRQTIPTKDVFAALTHHLCTAFVLLDGDGAHGTTFYQIIVEEHHRVVSSAGFASVLFARD